MSQCVVPDCGRPTSDFLCPGCITELVTALRELAFGPPDSKGIRQPGLAEDLEDMVCRLTNAQQQIGVLSKSAEKPLIFHVEASELSWVVRNTIATWARDFAETNTHLSPTYKTVPEAAEWMARYPGLLAIHPAAEELHSELVAVVDRVRSMVDRAPDLVYAGPCREVIDGHACPDHLFAWPNRATVRCRTCGTEHDVERRRELLKSAIEDQVVNSVQMSRLLHKIGVEIASSTIRTYAQTVKNGKPVDPKIREAARDGRGRPLYRVGDVLNVFFGLGVTCQDRASTVACA